MGRRYLPRSDRYPQRLRRLRRSWPRVGATGVNAPNASDPVKVNDIQWAFQFHSDAPKVGQSYAMTIKRSLIATGAAQADISITFTGAANDTAVQLAVKAAAALDAHLEIVSPVPSTRAVTFGLTSAAERIDSVTLTAAPTAAITPAVNDEPEEGDIEVVEVEVAPAAISKKARTK